MNIQKKDGGDKTGINRGSIIKVRAIPNALRTELREQRGDEYRIAVAAPPDKGKANKELIRFFRRELGLNVRVKSGASSRTKIIEVV